MAYNHKVIAMNKATEGTVAKNATKHEELTDTLRDMASQMNSGEKFPTQDALMRQFGVSDTTVLRALGELSRDGWIVRKQGSGTFVAPRPALPLSRPTPRTGLVVVMTRPSTSPIFYDLIQAVEAALFGARLAPVLIVDADAARRVARAQAYWKNGEVMGVIHVGSATLENTGDMPLVLLGETENGSHGQVSLDNAAAGRLVGEYLWDLNHRRVCVVSIGHATRTEGVDALRVAYFRALWEKRGGVLPDGWIITHPFLLRLGDEKRAVEIMRSYLEPIFAAPNPPTALFALHDEMALVAIRALFEMGLSVPGDVSVVGFNDSGTLAAYFQPALTTVRNPSAALGTLAVHSLLEMHRTGSTPLSVRLPPEIIVRESAQSVPETEASFVSVLSVSSKVPGMNSGPLPSSF